MAKEPQEPLYLFGDYFLEIAKYFSQIQSYRVDEEIDEYIPLQVFYGTPGAAYRRAYETNNGKIKLPMLSFFASDWKRVPGMEPILSTGLKANYNTLDKENKTIILEQVPMKFEVTYTVNLWTSNDTERDDLHYKINLMFPRGEISLVARNNPDNPDYFLFMPLKFDGAFKDETELEEKESQTRSIVKTSFNMTGSSTLPRRGVLTGLVQSIYFKSIVKDSSTSGAVATRSAVKVTSPIDDPNVTIEMIVPPPTF